MNRPDDKNALDDADIAELFSAATETAEPSADTDAAIRKMARTVRGVGQPPGAESAARYPSTLTRHRWLGVAAVVVLAVTLVPVLHRVETPSEKRTQDVTDAQAPDSAQAPTPIPSRPVSATVEREPIITESHAPKGETLPAAHIARQPATAQSLESQALIERAAESHRDTVSEPRSASAADDNVVAWRRDVATWLEHIRALIEAGDVLQAREEAALLRRQHARDAKTLGQLRAIMTRPGNSDPSPR